MQIIRSISKVAAGVLALSSFVPAFAAEITLNLASFPNGNHRYYHRLLEESLKATGNTVKIVSQENLPQLRIVAQIESSELTLHWFLQTKDRDGKFVPVNHNLTQGLIGQRVMLIPKGDEAVYAGVTDLEKFKALGKTAGLGLGWFDVSVWKESGLNVKEQGGDWKLLYKQVAAKDRGVDYFPRGATEIAAEVKDNPGLMIEPKLVLVYPRDFRFYLSKNNAGLKATLEAALAAAEKSGLQQKLAAEYFGPLTAGLNLDKRIKINLKNPPN